MDKKIWAVMSVVISSISGCGGGEPAQQATTAGGLAFQPEAKIALVESPAASPQLTTSTVGVVDEDNASTVTLPSSVSTSIVTVSTAAELSAAINRASNGTKIVLRDGIYAGPFTISGKHGVSSAGLIIESAHQGLAVISGNGGFSVVNSSFVMIRGLKFTNAATAVDVDGMIQHNYFHDALPQHTNGGETIRVGLSGLSMSDGFNTIQYNLFVNCDSDGEVVSVKSGHNSVNYNTFINNRAQVTSRHGHGNTFRGNYFFGDATKSHVGGFRIYGNDHKIYNNYMQGLTASPIELDSGDYDGGPDGYGSSPSKEELALHWRIYRAQVVNNTIVDSSTGILIGAWLTLPPVDVTIANNLVRNSTGILFQENAATNTIFENNIGKTISDLAP